MVIPRDAQDSRNWKGIRTEGMPARARDIPVGSHPYVRIRLGAISFDAVKHLLLCRVERRPPRLDLDCYPYLPKATVEKTRAVSYMRLLSVGAEGAA